MHKGKAPDFSRAFGLNRTVPELEVAERQGFACCERTQQDLPYPADI